MRTDKSVSSSGSVPTHVSAGHAYGNLAEVRSSDISAQSLNSRAPDFDTQPKSATGSCYAAPVKSSGEVRSADNSTQSPNVNISDFAINPDPSFTPVTRMEPRSVGCAGPHSACTAANVRNSHIAAGGHQR